MKFELTLDDMEEIAMCIVQCGLSENEAIKYAKTALKECSAKGEQNGDN